MKYDTAYGNSLIVSVEELCPTAEQRLFIAVINQALVDATLPPINKSLPRKFSTHTYQARAWLMGNSDDFRRVCEWGGVSPVSVREFARGLEACFWTRPGKHLRLSRNAGHRNKPSVARFPSKEELKACRE